MYVVNHIIGFLFIFYIRIRGKNPNWQKYSCCLLFQLASVFWIVFFVSDVCHIPSSHHQCIWFSQMFTRMAKQTKKRKMPVFSLKTPWMPSALILWLLIPSRYIPFKKHLYFWSIHWCRHCHFNSSGTLDFKQTNKEKIVISKFKYYHRFQLHWNRWKTYFMQYHNNQVMLLSWTF